MSAHTPGPWVAREWSCHAQTTVMAGEPGSEFVIADCAPMPYARDAEPNARLIAAAPDMLAALELVEKLISEALPKFNWGASALDGNAIRLLNEVPREVRLAVIKARGRGIGALLAEPKP